MVTTEGGLEVDVARHAGEQAPSKPVPKPPLGGSFELDSAVVEGESVSLQADIRRTLH